MSPNQQFSGATLLYFIFRECISSTICPNVFPLFNPFFLTKLLAKDQTGKEQGCTWNPLKVEWSVPSNKTTMIYAAHSHSIRLLLKNSMPHLNDFYAVKARVFFVCWQLHDVSIVICVVTPLMCNKALVMFHGSH